MATPKTPAFGSRFIPNMQQRFMEAVKMIDWGDTLSSEDIGENSNLFISKSNDAMSSFSRRGSVRDRKEHHLPWLNLQCRNFMKSRDQLLKQSLKSGLPTNRHKCTHARNKVTQTIRQAKANFFINIIEGAKGKSKNVWQILNKLLGKHKKQENQ